MSLFLRFSLAEGSFENPPISQFTILFKRWPLRDDGTQFSETYRISSANLRGHRRVLALPRMPGSGWSRRSANPA